MDANYCTLGTGKLFKRVRNQAMTESEQEAFKRGYISAVEDFEPLLIYLLTPAIGHIATAETLKRLRDGVKSLAETKL
jgi:hypothetical protein